MKSAVLCCALLAPAVSFGAGLSALEVLQRTSEAYRALRSYDVPAEVRTIRGGDVAVRHMRETQPDRFQQIDQHIRNATIARQEQFTVEGKPVPVYVVRVMRDPSAADDSIGKLSFTQYWIDQRTFLVHKVAKYSQGATEITLYSPASSTGAEEAKSIVGSQAPDFTLADASGQPVNLRKLQGKVLLVDFWATWCGPCRALMPHIEKMHRQFADKGLVVLGLNVGEDADTVTRFAKQHGYTFRLLLGSEPDVSASYFVTGYPTTFVIDRQGRIAYRDIGGSGVGGLQAAVERTLGSRQ